MGAAIVIGVDVDNECIQLGQGESMLIVSTSETAVKLQLQGEYSNLSTQQPSRRRKIVTIEVSSSAFEAGATIPKKHTGEGQDLSPPLQWSSLPQGTKEMALICDDPDAPTQKPFVHWVIYKIPADQKGLPEGGIEGALEGINDFGRRGYDGCMPPQGHGVHHYHFKVYALDTELAAPVGLSKDELLAAMGGSILDEGELVGTYER